MVKTAVAADTLHELRCPFCGREGTLLRLSEDVLSRWRKPGGGPYTEACADCKKYFEKGELPDGTVVR